MAILQWLLSKLANSARTLPNALSQAEHGAAKPVLGEQQRELEDEQLKKEATMEPTATTPDLQDLHALSVGQLIKQISTQSKELVRLEAELAKAEIREELKQEKVAGEWLGLGALFGIGAFCSLLTTAVVALSLVLPGWAAGLIVSGAAAFLSAAIAAMGWARRMHGPLTRTRRTLAEDLQWAKNRLA